MRYPPDKVVFSCSHINSLSLSPMAGRARAVVLQVQCDAQTSHTWKAVQMKWMTINRSVLCSVSEYMCTWRWNRHGFLWAAVYPVRRVKNWACKQLARIVPCTNGTSGAMCLCDNNRHFCICTATKTRTHRAHRSVCKNRHLLITAQNKERYEAMLHSRCKGFRSVLHLMQAKAVSIVYIQEHTNIVQFRMHGICGRLCVRLTEITIITQKWASNKWHDGSGNHIRLNISMRRLALILEGKRNGSKCKMPAEDEESTSN